MILFLVVTNLMAQQLLSCLFGCHNWLKIICFFVYYCDIILKYYRGYPSHTILGAKIYKAYLF